MAGSVFRPLDLVPSSLRPRLSPRSRVSHAQHGGGINNNLLPHNLTAYQASFLHNFETLPSASLSDLRLPQHDSYQQALVHDGYQNAIEALRDVPDDVLLQQLAQTRSDYSNSSNGLATIPESSPYPVMDFDIDHSAMQIPPSPMRQISQHIIPFNPQEPWDLGSHQHDPTYPPSFSTNPSYPSYKPSIFTEGSSKAPTEDSSIYSTGDFPPQVSGMEDVTRSYVIPGLPESSHDTANGPPGDTLPGTCSSADSPELTSRSRTTPASIKYSCTLCDSKATFRGKSEWKRHELSHMPSVEYVCLPEGHMDRDHRCAICGANNPDIQHVIEHNAHLCVAKDESARTWVRKDKFVKHLASHGLSSSCPQVAKWSRKLPPRISGCGFCIRGFNDSNERSLHVAKHFESGSQRTDWDHSKVILGQLGQPRTALSWQSILGATFGGQPSPPISWSESLASGIQKRLEEGRENGHDLALAAFELSSLCQTAKRDESDCDQPVLDPNEDTVHRVEHLLRDLDPSSQSWFDDSEPASELIGGWGFS